MHYHIAVTGARDEARASIVTQVDSLILAGKATPEVKVAALAIIDALPGKAFTGSIDGQIADPAVPAGDVQTWNITAMVTAN